VLRRQLRLRARIEAAGQIDHQHIFFLETGDLPLSSRLSELVRPRPTKLAGHLPRVDCRHNINSPLLPNKHTSTRLCESCDTLSRVDRLAAPTRRAEAIRQVALDDYACNTGTGRLPSISRFTANFRTTSPLRPSTPQHSVFDHQYLESELAARLRSSTESRSSSQYFSHAAWRLCLSANGAAGDLKDGALIRALCATGKTLSSMGIARLDDKCRRWHQSWHQKSETIVAR
jgi:hypothetical protein